LLSGPTRRIEGDRIFAITRYRDAMALLKSDDVAIVEVARNLNTLSARMGGNQFPNLTLLLGTSHPFQNGNAHRDAHQAIRSTIGVAMRHWTAERINRFARDLLKPAIGKDYVDAAASLSRPLPATIIAGMLGMDLDLLHHCTDGARRLASVWHRESIPLRELRALELVAADLVTLLQANVGGTRADDYAKLVFLSLAGVSTTKALLENAMHVLAGERGLQETLYRSPSLIPGFVNEVLRTRPPLRRIIGRRVNRDIMLSEGKLSDGALLMIDIERAQRDPGAFNNPDRFDIYRDGPPGLAFGVGAHACLGAALARLEARIFIERLVGDTTIHPAGDAELADDPDWNELKSLPVRLELRA
jgi:cytochrome P450